MSKTPVLILLIALLLASHAPTSAAHATKVSADGKVKVTWGWVSEPAFTMVLNRVELNFRDNATNVGIGDLEEAGLHIALHHGDNELDVETIRPQEGEAVGRYESTAAITPTARGIYVLHVEGTINGAELDLEIPATHEMEALSTTYFPEMEASDASALQARIATLEQKVTELDAKLKTQATTPTDVTTQTPVTTKPAPGLDAIAGIGALAAVALVLALRRRS